jgi:hypothetical protein
VAHPGGDRAASRESSRGLNGAFGQQSGKRAERRECTRRRPAMSSCISPWRGGESAGWSQKLHLAGTSRPSESLSNNVRKTMRRIAVRGRECGNCRYWVIPRCMRRRAARGRGDRDAMMATCARQTRRGTGRPVREKRFIMKSLDTQKRNQMDGGRRNAIQAEIAVLQIGSSFKN